MQQPAEEGIKRVSYYEFLKVSKNASREEITKAYRREALHWHPEKTAYWIPFHYQPYAALIFNRVHEAYEALITPKQRAAYDVKCSYLSETISSEEKEEAELINVWHKFKDGFNQQACIEELESENIAMVGVIAKKDEIIKSLQAEVARLKSSLLLFYQTSDLSFNRTPRVIPVEENSSKIDPKGLLKIYKIFELHDYRREIEFHTIALVFENMNSAILFRNQWSQIKKDPEYDFIFYINEKASSHLIDDEVILSARFEKSNVLFSWLISSRGEKMLEQLQKFVRISDISYENRKPDFFNEDYPKVENQEIPTTKFDSPFRGY
jgi:curved DNA-binding protein CbpA